MRPIIIIGLLTTSFMFSNCSEPIQTEEKTDEEAIRADTFSLIPRYLEVKRMTVPLNMLLPVAGIGKTMNWREMDNISNAEIIGCWTRVDSNISYVGLRIFVDTNSETIIATEAFLPPLIKVPDGVRPDDQLREFYKKPKDR